MNQPVAEAPYSLKAGWICIGSGSLAIVMFGPLGAIICGPLMIVSLILAIIGMAKNNTGGGIALFITSMVLPALAFLVWIVLFAFVKSRETAAVCNSNEPIAAMADSAIHHGQLSATL